MTAINHDLPALLKRRAKQLQADGYNEQFIGALVRAGDELDVRRRCAGDIEQTVSDTVADNRRLRQGLQGLFGRIRTAPMPKSLREDYCKLIAVTLATVPEAGAGRRIMTITMGDGITRAEAEAAIQNEFDKYFGVRRPLVEVEQELQAPFAGDATAAFHAHLDSCIRCATNPLELCPIGAGLLKGAADANSKTAHGVDGDSRPLGTGEPLPNL